MGKLIHPLFRAGLGGSEAGLTFSQLSNLDFGPSLGLGQPGDRSVESRDICVDRLPKDPEILLGNRIPQFLEHRPERLREGLGGRIAEGGLEIFVDAEDVRGGKVYRRIKMASSAAVEADHSTGRPVRWLNTRVWPSTSRVMPCQCSGRSPATVRTIAAGGIAGSPASSRRECSATSSAVRAKS
jgi:hypothetical protein